MKSFTWNNAKQTCFANADGKTKMFHGKHFWCEKESFSLNAGRWGHRPLQERWIVSQMFHVKQHIKRELQGEKSPRGLFFIQNQGKKSTQRGWFSKNTTKTAQKPQLLLTRVYNIWYTVKGHNAKGIERTGRRSKGQNCHKTMHFCEKTAQNRHF